HVVLDQQRRNVRPFQEPGQGLDSLSRLLDREALRRLVEQQHHRLLCHRHRHLEKPLVAVTEEAGGTLGNGSETQQLERRVAGTLRLLEHARPPEREPPPPVARLPPPPDILPCRPLRGQTGQLETPP